MKEMAEKYIRSMVKNGFMSGFFGDVSEVYIEGQIALLLSNPKMVGSWIAESVPNLSQYCEWTKEDVEELAKVFDFKIVERQDLVAGFGGELNE